jgi:Malectin domain
LLFANAHPTFYCYYYCYCYYVFTTILPNLIANTDNDELYRTNRYGDLFSYEIPVPAAQTYIITLHMAELFWSEPGQRVFNVELEGMVKLSNYDIVASTGGKFTAEIRTFREFIDDGFVSIQFTKVVDNAQVSGITVIAA